MSSLALAPSAVRSSGRTGEALLLGCGVVLLTASAQVVVPLPFSPVPVTGQTFAVLLIATLYGAARASITLAAYISLGAFGAPVFAGFASGWGVLGAPSAGYLVGMLACAAVVGLLADRGWDRSVGRLLLTLWLGNLVVYVFGTAWLALSLRLSPASAVTLGVLPFLVGDALKIAAVAGTRPAAGRVLRTRGPTRSSSGAQR